jgi:hypothetical protein
MQWLIFFALMLSAIYFRKRLPLAIFLLDAVAPQFNDSSFIWFHTNDLNDLQENSLHLIE